VAAYEQVGCAQTVTAYGPANRWNVNPPDIVPFKTLWRMATATMLGGRPIGVAAG
jgi:hypothetical protein